MTEARRSSERGQDSRLDLLERDVTEVLNMVRTIDQALRFPEQSPLGRDLLGRADRNAGAIEKLQRTDERHDEAISDLKSRADEQEGVVKFLRLVSVLLGIAVALYTLAQLSGAA